MSGHSHWSSIKHKKGREDAKKGKAFSRASRAITLASREGGGDPDKNIKLLYAIEAARAINMPKDTIERAVKKGTGELEGAQLEAFLYEGFGHGDATLMIEGVTDNKTRTLNEVRNILETHGGKMGVTNSVAWNYEQKGMFTVSDSSVTEDRILEDALEAGAENVEHSGDLFEITCATTDFAQVKKALSAKFELRSAEFARIPKTYVKLDEKKGRKILRLLEALDNHDDVTQVHANFDLPDSLVAENAG